MATTSRELQVTFVADTDEATRAARALDRELAKIEARLGRIKGAIVARPGDVVVLAVDPQHMSTEQGEAIRGTWTEQFPDVRLALVALPLVDA